MFISFDLRTKKGGLFGLKLKDKIAIVTGASQGIGKGIAFQVNALSPGPILASLQQRAYPSEKLLDSRNRAVLMNRHGTPEEIARVVI